MKNLIAFILLIVMAFTMISCGPKKSADEGIPGINNQTEEAEDALDEEGGE